MIVYIDMDDVLCQYSKAYYQYRKQFPSITHPQSIPDFFVNLNPVSQAIESVHWLLQHDVFRPYILTAPSTRNPLSYMEKRIWIEKHLGYPMVKRLILSPDKGLLKGDLLIDDNASGKGQDRFTGKLIHFGSDDFPCWESVITWLKKY